MTQKQLTKLETRIATLKAQKRIVWIEGIEASVIKGKIAGKQVFFVKADSLNANGGSWYYIVRWESVEWRCSCEATKPCKHENAVKARVNAQFQPTKAEQAEAKAISERLQAELVLHQAEQYTKELEETRQANVRYMYSGY